MEDYGTALWEWLRAVDVLAWVNVGGLLVAGVGISLTLLQLRLLRRQLKLDALIRIMDSNRAIVTLEFEHPAVWSALQSSAALLAEEVQVRRRYLQLWTNHMQMIWAAWNLGLVSGREWEAYRRDMADFLRIPAWQEHWAKVGQFYPKGFRRLVGKLEQSQGDRWKRMRIVQRHNPQSRVTLAKTSGTLTPGGASGFGRAVHFLVLGENPGVRVIRHFAQQQEVVSPEGFGGLPLVAVFVEAVEGGVIANATFGVVSPDCGFDGAEPDFMDGFCFCVLHRKIWVHQFAVTVHKSSVVKKGVNRTRRFYHSLQP
ncbi:MAG: hypothetical protein HZA90_12950 [Verrucomicrobia bacterium]|nr:hypothetical protein [Verrucomicrobiota bacterium]